MTTGRRRGIPTYIIDVMAVHRLLSSVMHISDDSVWPVHSLMNEQEREENSRFERTVSELQIIVYPKF